MVKMPLAPAVPLGTGMRGPGSKMLSAVMALRSMGAELSTGLLPRKTTLLPLLPPLLLAALAGRVRRKVRVKPPPMRLRVGVRRRRRERVVNGRCSRQATVMRMRSRRWRRRQSGVPRAGQGAVTITPWGQPQAQITVSYTHLTLPTILLV